MIQTIQLTVLLLAVIAVVAVVAVRMKMPPAILLVVTGVGLALAPGLPAMVMAPEFVLLIVLPPLIYWSAVVMSWREFRFNLRPISLLSVGCVLFTTVAVAWTSHVLLHLSWPVGFVLGAVVSPPDPVAPLSIARRLGLPRRLIVILEGEGLANDATALVLYRFAVTAVSVGAFSFTQATGMFAAILVGELLWGIGVGWAMLRLRRLVGDTGVEILLSILTPFIAFWAPEQLGGSGVLATVTAGLYISWNGPRLISATTRLQGVFFWDFLTYLIEGLVFLVTGLQARMLFAGISAYRVSELVSAAAIVSSVVIVTRFVWVYPAVYVPRWLIPAVRRSDPSPPWQWAFALGFTGIRGVVSLTAALAIPLVTQDGQAFPQRDLITFLAFTVILVTLVGQGLTLPLVIRWLGLANTGRRERRSEVAEELSACRQAIDAAIARLDKLEVERGLSADMVRPFRTYYRDRRRNLAHRSEGEAGRGALIAQSGDIELLLIAAERDSINVFYRQGKLKDEARRQIERTLDLREADIFNQSSEDSASQYRRQVFRPQ
jgi:monovalent cation/hydrogen antiporter